MKKVFAIIYLLFSFHSMALAGIWYLDEKDLDKYLPEFPRHIFVVAQADAVSGCDREYYFADNDRLSPQDKQNLRALTAALENENSAHVITWGDEPVTHEQFRRLVDDRLHEKTSTPLTPGRSLNGLLADKAFLLWAGADTAKAVEDWRRLRLTQTPNREAQWVQAADKLSQILFKRFWAGHIIVTTCDTD